ncbi:Nn.00g111840.m01.CDS01 [Neocucurbitaria sp. VM-36]
MGANNSVPANYSAAAYAVLILEVILTTAAVVGRTVSRKLMKAKLSTDDALTYAAYSANVGLLVSGLLLTAFGSVDLDDVSTHSEEKHHFVRAAYISLAVLYVLAITFIKLSILFLYRRTFTMFETWFRWAWWSLMHLVILWTATCVVLLAIQGVGQMPMTRFSRLGVSITGFVNAFSDIWLLMMPAIMISRMKLQKKQKIALVSIFGIGGVAAMVSTIRATIFLINRNHQLNEAYSNYLDIVLTSTESSAGFMCACLPLTKPIVIHFTRRIQRLRGLNTEHQGWTTVSTSQKSTSKEKDRTILRVDDYHIQLLPIALTIGTQSTSRLQREAMVVDRPWESVGPYETTAYCNSHRL